MSNNLYFIPMIARAIQEPDAEKALREAFCEIKRKGADKRYAEGFENFELFMDTVHVRHDAVVTDYVRQLMVEFATGTFEGSEQEKDFLSDMICSRTEWMAEYLMICRQEAREDLMPHPHPVIGLLDERGLTREVAFTEVPACESIDDIVPGSYKIKLVNTGWMIWEGELTAEELIWSEAHRGQDLRAVAGAAKEEPTNEIDLLHSGDLILRTYAKAEKGRIEIELTM